MKCIKYPSYGCFFLPFKWFKLDITKTPTVIINKNVIDGIKPYYLIKSEIELLLNS